MSSESEFGRMSIKDGDSNHNQSSPWHVWFEQYVQPCFAEVIGTTMFLFIGIMSVVENTDGTGRLQPALAHGLALGLSIAVLGGISGGHFNPAVSLGATIIGGLNIFMLIPYWISQLCGGLIAAGLAKAITPENRYNNVSGAAFTTISSDAQIANAIGAEIIMTFYLVLAVCMGAINEKTKTPLAPFAIGFTITVDVLAGGRGWQSTKKITPHSVCLEMRPAIMHTERGGGTPCRRPSPAPVTEAKEADYIVPACVQPPSS